MSPPLLQTGRRERAAVGVLLATVMATVAALAWVFLNTARDIRIRNAMDRNQATAEITARLLDAQWDSVTSVLQALAQRTALRECLGRRDARAAAAELQDAVRLVPDLLFLTAYDTRGRLIASHPAVESTPTDASGEGWFRQAMSSRQLHLGEVRRLGAGGGAMLQVAAPVLDAGQPAGFLFGCYRLGDLDASLRGLRVGGGARLYIVDRSGMVIEATGPRDWAGLRLADNAAHKAAQAGRPGALAGMGFGGSGQSLIGYGLARRPLWSVLVEQPLDAALASTNYLANRMLFLGAPLMLAVAASAGLLAAIYHRNNLLRQRLAAQNERLEAADRAKSDFLANVSHDLRTPLTAIQITLSGLLEPGVHWQESEVREQLQAASDEVDHLGAQVRNLLEMARLESQGAPTVRELCNVADAVRAAVERAAPLTRRHRVEMRLSHEPLLAECDAAQIEMVVVNLLENAAKYASPGTRLRVRSGVAGGCVRVAVEDEGPGVPEAEAQRVFEKFHRGENSHGVPGTGLGLAICRTVVERHGGQIGVRAASGGGAEFWFTLPAESLPVELAVGGDGAGRSGRGRQEAGGGAD